MPGFFKVEVSIGTIHDSRFTFLSEKTLLHLGDFDGDFTELMSDLAKGAGPVFDAIFRQVENPPPSPVAANVDVFLESAGVHLAHPLNLYTAYPGATAKEIKALAAAAGVTGGAEQRPFLSYPSNPRSRSSKCNCCCARGHGTTKDMDKVGAPPSPCRKHLQDFIDFPPRVTPALFKSDGV